MKRIYDLETSENHFSRIPLGQINQITGIMTHEEKPFFNVVMAGGTQVSCVMEDENKLRIVRSRLCAAQERFIEGFYAEADKRIRKENIQQTKFLKKILKQLKKGK